MTGIALAGLCLFVACQPPPSSTPANAAPRAVAVAPAMATQEVSPTTPGEPRHSAPRTSDPELQRLEQLKIARDLFQRFIDRADGRAEFDEPIQLARERIADIGEELEFLQQGLAERRLEDLGTKNR